MLKARLAKTRKDNACTAKVHTLLLKMAADRLAACIATAVYKSEGCPAVAQQLAVGGFWWQIKSLMKL